MIVSTPTQWASSPQAHRFLLATDLDGTLLANPCDADAMTAALHQALAMGDDFLAAVDAATVPAAALPKAA
jgi:hypothetical protein